MADGYICINKSVLTGKKIPCIEPELNYDDNLPSGYGDFIELEYAIRTKVKNSSFSHLIDDKSFKFTLDDSGNVVMSLSGSKFESIFGNRDTNYSSEANLSYEDIAPTFDNEIVVDEKEVGTLDIVTVDEFSDTLLNVVEQVAVNDSYDDFKNGLKSAVLKDDNLGGLAFSSSSSDSKSTDDSTYTTKSFSIDKPRNYNKEFYGVSNSTIRSKGGVTSGYVANVTHYLNGKVYKTFNSGSAYVSFNVAESMISNSTKSFHKYVAKLNKLSTVKIIPDFRIPSNCCIEYLCEPTKYKRI